MNNLHNEDLSKSQIDIFEKKVIEIESAIEETTLQLFQREKVFSDIVEKIKTSLGFDFATIQLIRPEEEIIEAVYGANAEWTGRARHYIEPDSELRDIQADICQTCFTEIIAGCDPNQRFDQWVYKFYNHQDYVRIFTPMILVQDQQGANDDKWVNEFSLKLIKNEVDDSWFELDQRHKLEDNGQHSIVQIILPKSYIEYEIKVIGAIELGYKKSSKPIKVERLYDIIKSTGKWALDIRKTQLPCILEKIAKIGMDVIKANGTSIHFIESASEKPYIHKVSDDGSIKKQLLKVSPDGIHYTYEVFSGLITRDLIKNNPPRKAGLGQEAIIANKLIFVPDPDKGDDANKLEHSNPEIFALGIRGIVALPLIVDNQKGVFYFHFIDNKPFNKRLISLLNVFDNRVENAIYNSITYEHQRDKAIQLMILHSVTQSLTQIQNEKDLLSYIAWNSLNVLAADVVSIYRYIQAENNFPQHPVIAGRLKFIQEAQAKIDESDVPSKIVKYGNNIYSPEEEYQNTFKDSSFAKRENIKSTASILLKANNQTVGVMFVNYRRYHSFSEDEKRIIETLAASAAIAVMNQQWLEALSDIDRQIKTASNLEKLLSLIMQRAVQLTGANLGDIRLFSSVSQELIMEVWHPKNVQKDGQEVSTIRTKLGEGITGWVAQYRKPALVDDVTTDSRYITYFEKSGSELCVPLMNQDYLLGVINLESYQKKAFEARHLQMLEALADQAVIAIQNFRNKEHLVKVQTLMTMGNLASPLIHRMNNDIGAIRVWAKDILTALDRGEKPSKEKISKILKVAEQVLEHIGKMNIFIQDQDKLSIDVFQVLQKAFEQVGKIPSNIVQKIELPQNLPKVLGSELQLIYVFDNLIRNAVEAMPEGGELLIESQILEKKVAVLINDTGEGISKDKQEKIFQPGYTTHSSSKGMGFGLWWTQAYIDSLGGSITVNSELGKGAQFIVTLPIEVSKV